VSVFLYLRRSICFLPVPKPTSKGMGKTVQTIATILDNRPKLQRCVPGGKYPPHTEDEKTSIDAEEALWDKSLNNWKHEMKMNDVHPSILPKDRKNGEPGGGARAGTLVICPGKKHICRRYR